MSIIYFYDVLKTLDLYINHKIGTNIRRINISGSFSSSFHEWKYIFFWNNLGSQYFLLNLTTNIYPTKYLLIYFFMYYEFQFYD